MQTPNVRRSFRDIIAEGSRDLFVVTDVAGSVEFVSRTSHQLFGWEPDQLVGSPLERLAHPEDAPVLSRALGRAERSADDVVTTMWRIRCADGSHRWVESLSTLVVEGDDRFVVSTVRDLSGRHETEIDLRQKATTDSLTGVANRVVLMERVETALQRLGRHGGGVALLFLDLDRFKHINDTMGHRAGDAILTQLATRLRSLLRPEDTVARLGGDEFVVLVEDVRSTDAVSALADRIVAAVRIPFTVGGREFSCTTSVGMTISTDPRRDPEDLLEEADLALYRAKREGRDRADSFDEALRRRSVTRLGLERTVRRALAEERLTIVYRPVVDLATGATVVVEAQPRMWDPDRGLFVPVHALAGESDDPALLAPLEQWTLDRVIQQAAAWNRRVPGQYVPAVSLTLSPRQLVAPGTAADILKALGTQQLPASALQFEVPERTFVDVTDGGLEALALLRAAGARVGLDEFGTGLLSLHHLRRLPIDHLTFDHTLTARLGDDPGELAVVSSMVALCHALGLLAVADGVDRTDQRDALVAAGCDRARGALAGRAVPHAAIQQLVLATD